MINLHERLSEFSYGYGATREVEHILASTGISTTPFLPSLLHEAELGFDVAFNRRGIPLLLQFKLGQSLTKFVRKDLTLPPPKIDRPFWRYEINTAEPEGQFHMLLKADLSGAEVYYVAPRFNDWTDYIAYYETNSVLENSLLVSPSNIRDALDSVKAADGPHRVVYDQTRSHICSRPVRIPETRSEALGQVIRTQIKERDLPLAALVRETWKGLERVLDVRRKEEEISDAADTGYFYVSDERRPTRQALERQRSRRLNNLRSSARTENDALALALGVEFWGLGAQLVLATVDE